MIFTVETVQPICHGMHEGVLWTNTHAAQRYLCSRSNERSKGKTRFPGSTRHLRQRRSRNETLDSASPRGSSNCSAGGRNSISLLQPSTSSRRPLPHTPRKAARCRPLPRPQPTTYRYTTVPTGISSAGGRIVTYL